MSQITNCFFKNTDSTEMMIRGANAQNPADRQDPAIKLPLELLANIFSYLAFSDLTTCCQLSKNWLGKELLNNRFLVRDLIYTSVAFSRKDWNAYFGEDTVTDDDFQSLPLDIKDILLSPCPVYSVDQEPINPLVVIWPLVQAVISSAVFGGFGYLILIADFSLVNDIRYKNMPATELFISGSLSLVCNIIFFGVTFYVLRNLSASVKTEFKNAFPKISPQTRMIETHVLAYIPKTINGINEEARERVDLTLHELGKLFKECSKRDGIGIDISGNVARINQSIDASRWVLISKDNLPRSFYKNIRKLQRLIDNLSIRSGRTYTIPSALEVVIGSCAKQMKHLASDREQSRGCSSYLLKTSNMIDEYSICRETIQQRRVFVGSKNTNLEVVTSRDVNDDFETGREYQPIHGVKPLHRLQNFYY